VKRILLADDHQLFREGLKALLAGEADRKFNFRLAGAAG
jgi:DNA-binding NarL/FixJ family response regulator